MITLTSAEIALGIHAADREAAIRAVGRLLVMGGFIEAGYVESMLGRELQANTYLGNGIAIPHGMAGDRALITRTGVAVVQIPAGVEWNPGQIVHLVVGIAARSDEHLGILAALSDVLDDPELAARLASTVDADDIVAALARSGATNESSPALDLAGALHVDVLLGGTAGLHARPAAFLVDVAGRFVSDIHLQYREKSASARAMASLLKLGVESGEMVRLIATGPDAAEALEALRQAVESGLGEEEEESTPSEAVPQWRAESTGRAITGVSASPGLAIGPLHRFQATRIVVADRPMPDAEVEKRQFRQALETAREQLNDLYETISIRSGQSEAMIFRAHQGLLMDADIFDEVSALIDRGHGAAWSWQNVIESRATDMLALGNERLAGRAADLRDVGQRVLRLLADTAYREADLPSEPVILIADDLTPSDTARLDPRRILGLCIALGGATSHTAIIARSLDIPAVVGAGPHLLEQPDGAICILDGAAGRLYVDPNPADLESARSYQEDLLARRADDHDTRFEPAILKDGHRVEIVANIGRASEAADAVEAGAEGVGLMRSEFLFLDRATPPGEEEQYEAYSQMARALDGLPLIIRTLDIGGDKVVPYLMLPKEDNPFLGVRGIRLCLRRPDLFIPQLRAIYRASAHGDIRIMLPMVATVEELREARQIAEQVRRELSADPVEIGIMVEVPSAVMIADELAREADFFSIGTNDLAQYLLAIDRMHPTLATQLDGLHPAVLRMIEMTVRAATGAGKWVGVCGGIAGDPLGALVLTGLGVAELSMSVPGIASVKASMRKYSFGQAQAFARRALACATAAEVRALPLP